MPDSGGGPSSPSSPSSPSDGGSSATPSSAAPATSLSGGGAAPPGGSSAPSSAEPSPPSEDVDFSMIFGDGPEPSVASSPTPAPAPQVPPAPQQPAPAPAVQPAPVQPPGTVDGAPASPAPTGTPSPAAGPTLDPYDPGALSQALSQSEAQAIQHVADTVFKLSAEEVEALENDTVGTVPKLLAKALVRSQMNLLQTMSRLVPAMIQRQTAVMKRQMEHEQKFYTRWPDIKQDTHGDLVTKYAVLYRQANPTLSTDEMIEAVGPMVMIAGKVTPSAAPGASASPPSPMAPAPGARPQASPFTPAAPFAGGPMAPQPVELTPVEAMFDPNQG